MVVSGSRGHCFIRGGGIILLIGLGRMWWLSVGETAEDLEKVADYIEGNRCSATQSVPVISDGPNKTKRLVQFSPQPHWLAERPNPNYSRSFQWAMRYITLAMRLYRFYLYAMMERDFLGFYQETGVSIREDQARTQIEYIKRTAPAKYHEALVPRPEIGC